MHKNTISFKLLLVVFTKIGIGILIGSWVELVMWLLGDDNSSLKVVLWICRGEGSFFDGDYKTWIWVILVFVMCVLISTMVLRVFFEVKIKHGLLYSVGLVWGLFGIFANPAIVNRL